MRIVLGDGGDFQEAEVMQELRGVWVDRGRWGSGSRAMLVLVQKRKTGTSVRMRVIPADICTKSSWEGNESAETVNGKKSKEEGSP
jgi:hypothetical protein